MLADQGRQGGAIPKATCEEGLYLHLPGGLVCKGGHLFLMAGREISIYTDTAYFW